MGPPDRAQGGGRGLLDRLAPRSIGARLTLWYATALAVLSCALAATSYALLARSSLRRVDRTLQETARTFAAAWVARQAATPGRVVRPAEVIGSFRAGELQLVIVDETRRVVATTPGPSSPGPAWTPEPGLLASVARIASAEGTLFTVSGSGAPRRAFALPLGVGRRRQLVLVAQGLGSRAATLRDARAAYLVAIPLFVALAGVGGLFLARRALAPVAALGAQAERIGASTLHERVRVGNARDELGRLARTINDLLARLDRAFDQQRQFMADAAHELRTPVAVVQTEAEVTLSRDDRPAAEYRESLGVIRDEARRISRIVSDLFLLARADAGQQPLAPEELYLDDLVGDAVRSVRTLAAARGVSIEYVPPDAELPFRGDEALLRRLVVNLLDNAIKYGPAGGHVAVRASAADGSGGRRYGVAVHNEGAPIPADVQGRLFDRFFRGPDAEAAGDTGTGAGLGLAIGRWIAEAHGGTLDLVRSDASGTEFRVTLPAS